MEGAVQIAGLIGAVVALVTLAKAILEYSRANRLKRAEHFFHLRERMYGKESFSRIACMLDNKDKEIANIDVMEREEFLGLYEEVAISLNSKLISEEVAHYMFGYYAMRCWENNDFWRGFDRDSIYWSEFRRFYKRMQEIEKIASTRSTQKKLTF